MFLSDVPVHSAMSKSLPEARLQTWAHQQHRRLQTPGQKGKIKQMRCLHVLLEHPLMLRSLGPLLGLCVVRAQRKHWSAFDLKGEVFKVSLKPELNS